VKSTNTTCDRLNPLRGRCHGALRRGVACLVWAAVWSTGWWSGAEAAGIPAAVDLEWRRSEIALSTFGLDLQERPTPFRKEPPVDPGETIWRGDLKIGASVNNSWPLLWSVTQARLHLDLNRNGDLTDDTNSVFISESKNDYQQFTGLRLELESASGRRTFLLDLGLHRWSADRLYGSCSIRSYWSGRANWQGADLELGVVEMPAPIRGKESGFLILRPWSEHEKPLRLSEGSAEAFSSPKKLFYLGGAAAVAKTFADGPRPETCRLAFTAEQPPMGAVTLQGSHIDRLIFEPEKGGFTAVIDKPGTKISMPVGSYRLTSTWLRKDAAQAGGTPGLHVLVKSDSLTNVVTGGPLTNSVTARRQGRRLVVDHRVVGVDGREYRLRNENRQRPPKVTILLGEKVVNSGKFAYG